MTTTRQWKQWNATGKFTCYPYMESFDLVHDRITSWTCFWEDAGETAIVLESGKSGRYTIAAMAPREWISGSLTEGNIFSSDGSFAGITGDPLYVLRKWMAPYRAPKLPGAPKFLGGIAGFLAYDVIRTLERLPDAAAADSPVPDYFFMRVGQAWIVDHQEHKLICAVHAMRDPEEERWNDDRLEHEFAACSRQVRLMREQWKRWEEGAAARQRASDTLEKAIAASVGTDIKVADLPGLHMTLASSQFQDCVRKIQQYIAQGDVFQVNLSVRQSKALSASPELIYETLRRINPSPYMGYLRMPGNRALVSASPELLIRLEDERLSTRPIAGTRPRGANQGMDVELQRELLVSEKERAEHVMLVDLERNDLGRIAAYGTVRVKEFMAVERYSHVMHIVSEVEGLIAEGKDAFDVVAAVFPGGTITGAPKVRTMEIIEELEPVRRGAYTGSIGWIDYNGNMELNITIRTLVYSQGTAYVQSGAGIVIDSIPEHEFHESLNKAKALWKAVEISEQAAAWSMPG